MFVLPVKLAGAWVLYLTQRSTKQQSSVRISANFRRLEKEERDIPRAAYNLDQLMHALGRNAMAYWLKLLLQDSKGAVCPTADLSKNKAGVDIVAGYS